MKIVVDTNVVISGVFFGGAPRRVIEAVATGEIRALASAEITEEYSETVQEMIERKQGNIRQNILTLFLSKLDMIEPRTKVEVSRDPDDDKFISCAVDGKALYIVSGDLDLLDIGTYDGIEIIKAADFCERYIDNKTGDVKCDGEP